MNTSEWVSPGHPDKVADGIVSFILDRQLERDPLSRFALECQIKDNFVTLGGEITSIDPMGADEIAEATKAAVRAIGYTSEYAVRWGRENAIDADALEIVQHIGRQSPDIARGVNADGWGDQGIMWGMAYYGKDAMPPDFAQAKKLGMALYELSAGGSLPGLGLDIKTQVSTDEFGFTKDVIVAIPMLGSADEIEDLRRAVSVKVAEITGFKNAVINGTGAYVRHASQGDCGTTGRKLAVDFYGGNCRIGGGCPWGKDPSKADVTLNIYAREKAVELMRKQDRLAVYCSISCCIGRKEIQVSFFDERLNLISAHTESRPAPVIIEELDLYSPVYAFKNRNGLFTRPN